MLAEQASYLRYELTRIIAEDANDPQPKLWKHPLDSNVIKSIDPVERGAWQFRAWSTWQTLYWTHITFVTKFGPAGFKSPITNLKSPETFDNDAILDFIKYHRGLLVDVQTEILKDYDSAADGLGDSI
jgi:hypothetical protein